jgi:hypothetical protein
MKVNVVGILAKYSTASGPGKTMLRVSDSKSSRPAENEAIGKEEKVAR